MALSFNANRLRREVPFTHCAQLWTLKYSSRWREPNACIHGVSTGTSGDSSLKAPCYYSLCASNLTSLLEKDNNQTTMMMFNTYVYWCPYHGSVVDPSSFWTILHPSSLLTLLPLLVTIIMTPYLCLQRLSSEVLRPHTHQSWKQGVWVSALSSSQDRMESRLSSIPQDLFQPSVFICSQPESPKNSNTCAFKATPRHPLQPSLLRAACQWIAPATWYNIVMATSSIGKPEQCRHRYLFVQRQATDTRSGIALQ